MNVLVIEDRHDKYLIYSDQLNRFFNCNIEQHNNCETSRTSIRKTHCNLILISQKLLRTNNNFLHEIKLIQENSNYSVIVLTDLENTKECNNVIPKVSKKSEHNCYYIQENNIPSKEFTQIMHKAALNSLVIRPNNQKSLNILIIEDSIDDYELCSRILKVMFDCNISHYLSPEKALQAIKIKNYDLIFVDHNLPTMTGTDFLCELNLMHNELPSPIIALTAQGNENVAVEFMKLGVSDYICKYNLSLEFLSKVIYKAFYNFYNMKLRKEKHSELLLFAHTLAHDIKAPLTRLSSYSRLLLKANNAANHDKYINNIIEDTAYMVEFVDNILRFAELGRSVVHKEEVNLNIVLEQSVKNLEIDITNRKANIIVSKLPVIYGDKLCLVQLFQNLISNALKYCISNPVIKIYSEIKNNFLVINVADNGIGILKKMAKKIFKPFTRVVNGLDTNGLGLGLALCDLIAKQHHAKINIYPQKTGGTIFSIILPEYSCK